MRIPVNWQPTVQTNMNTQMPPILPNFLLISANKTSQPIRFVLLVACLRTLLLHKLTWWRWQTDCFDKKNPENSSPVSILMHLVLLDKHHSKHKNFNGCLKTCKYCLTSYLLRHSQVSKTKSEFAFGRQSAVFFYFFYQDWYNKIVLFLLTIAVNHLLNKITSIKY